MNERGDNTFIALSFIKDPHPDAETLANSSNLANAHKEMFLLIYQKTILVTTICERVVPDTMIWSKENV